MSGNGRRRLVLKRETLRRIAAGDLGRVAGGLLNLCTYGPSTCQGGPSGGQCYTDDCQSPTEDCDGDKQI
jgi:hypothetical protein